MAVTIRRAAAGDEPVLRALRLEALRDAPAAFASTYEREASRTTADWQRWMSPGVTFLLERDGVASGLVAGVHDQTDSAVIFLLAMWLHPALRGTGAADMLVASVISWAAEQRAREVRLNIAKANTRAQRCYERNGFVVTGRVTVRQADGFVEVEMAKRLAA